MISHHIIVHKPKVTVPRQEPQTLTSVIPLPTSGVIPLNVNHKKVKNQVELIQHLNKIGFFHGDVVIMDRIAKDKISKYQLHLVIDVNRFYPRVEFGSHTGEPKCYQLAQIYSGTNTPWVRWDDANSYRKPTDEERKEFVEADYDFIQNQYKEYCAKYKRNSGWASDPGGLDSGT